MSLGHVAMDQAHENTTALLPIPDGSLSFSHVWIFSVVILVPNSLALVALYRSKNMPSSIKILSLNLACSDLSMGLSMVYAAVIKLFFNTCPLDVIKYMWSSVSVIVAMLTIAAFATDRFMSVYFTMKYLMLVSNRVLILCCVFIWALSIGVVVMATVSYKCLARTYHVGPGTLYVLGSVCTIHVILMYIAILGKVMKLSKLERRMGLTFKKSIDSQISAALKIMTIVVPFVATFVPFIIFISWLYFNPEFDQKTSPLPRIVSTSLVVHCFIDPFLYAWRFTECRHELLKMLCFWNPKKFKQIEKSSKVFIAPYLNNEPRKTNPTIVNNNGAFVP